MQAIETLYEGYEITTDSRRMQTAMIHQWLTEISYWAPHIPYNTVQGMVDNAFCIGAFKTGEQVAFARLITDYSTFAYLADVFVLEAHRGMGIGKEMMRILFVLDWVQKLRRIMLATVDAHELYRKVGFDSLGHPERIMEIVRPDIYG